MFDVADYRESTHWYDKWWGYVRPHFPLTLKAISRVEENKINNGKDT